MTEQEAHARAATLPGSFHYHVQRVAAAEHSPSGQTSPVRLRYLPSSDAIRHVLDVCRSPQAVQSILAAPGGPSASSRGHRLEAVQALIRAGLLVQADGEDPFDASAVYHAARVLYGFFQIESEMTRALQEMYALRPRVVAEIGTAYGGSLFCWAQAAHPEALLVSVDIPDGVGGGGYRAESVPHFQNFCFDTQRLVCVNGDSSDPSVVAQVRDVLDGRSIDLLFIDGDHSYEGVKGDFERYAPMVSPGGAVLFHDIQPQTSRDPAYVIEVPTFWNEVSPGGRFREFIDSAGQDGGGIGVLYVD